MLVLIFDYIDAIKGYNTSLKMEDDLWSSQDFINLMKFLNHLTNFFLIIQVDKHQFQILDAWL